MITDSIAQSIIAFYLSLMPVSLPEAVTMNDFFCMVEAIHFESQGEQYEGKQATASVIMKRVKMKRYFKNTVCGVIHQSIHFTYLSRHDLKIRITTQEEYDSFYETVNIAFLAAYGVLPDNTGGADHYLNKDTVLRIPKWAIDPIREIKINRHTYVKVYPDNISL